MYESRKKIEMEKVENLYNKTTSSIYNILNTKTVVGDPITIKVNTLIPLISVGFGFGAGGWRRKRSQTW